MAIDYKEATKRIEAGVDEMFTSGQFTEYLDVMSRFHSYSYRNMLLIKHQLPEASRVAGYKTWQEIGRQVKHGTHGINILAPYVKTYDVGTGKKDENGNEIMEKQPVTRFMVVTVFDVSQTEGKELPEIARELTGDVPYFDNIMNALQKMTDYRFAIETGDVFAENPNAKGLCDYSIRTIFIRDGMSQAQTLKTAVHELFHSRNHGADMEPKSRQMKEIEAEAAAYVVCAHFGLDTSDYSFGYVASWARDVSHETRRSLIRGITGEAKEIINKMEAAMGLNRDSNGFLKEAAEEKLKETAAAVLPDADGVDVKIYNQIPAEEKSCYVNMVNEAYGYNTALYVSGLKTSEVTSLLYQLSRENLAGGDMVSPDVYLSRYGADCTVQEHQEDINYIMTYNLEHSSIRLFDREETSKVSALVSYKGNIREDVAFAGLCDKETYIDGVAVNLNPVREEPISEPFISRLDRYEDLGYDQTWPMVDVTYSNVADRNSPAMNIAEAVKFVEKLDNSAFSAGNYMKIRIKYTYNDWKYEHVQDLDFGKGRLNFIDYLNLPVNIINHLKSHAALIDLTNKAARFAPDTNYGTSFADRMLDWSTYCRMELNHNSDAPVLPDHPQINSNYRTNSDILFAREE